MPPAAATAGPRRPRSLPERLSQWAWQRRLRRDLARRDRAAAQAAEMHRIRTFVVGARALVGTGWVQGGWFTHRTDRGELRTTAGWDVFGRGGGPVTGACLVGAIAHAGGGAVAVDGQPVQRAFDLTWHTLFADRGDPVRYCPAPAVRAAHLRDLIRWNDDPRRTASDVVALLDAVERAAGAEVRRLGQQLGSPADPPGRC